MTRIRLFFRTIGIVVLMTALLLTNFTSCSLSAVSQPNLAARLERQADVSETLAFDSVFLITQAQGQQQEQQEQEQQEQEQQEQQEQRQRRLPTRPIRNRSFWSRLLGLGRRGSCNTLDPPLIPLMPPPNEGTESLAEGLESALAFTVSAYPTFWFYVPEQLQQIEFAEFMMQDENDEDVFEQPIQVRLRTSGIVGLELPAREHPLEPEMPYHWYFSVVCDSNRPSRNPSVDGWVERISPSLNVRLQPQQDDIARTLERLYAANAWYDAFTLLLNLRCDDPRNSVLNTYWPDMLQALMNLQELNQTKADFCPRQRELEVVYETNAAGDHQRQSPTST